MKNKVDEMAISHKLAEYLQDEFQDWNVDCEYNRDMDKVKYLDGTKRFIPDIVIHKRSTNKNLIIVEVKKEGGEKNNEENRLKEATDGKGTYNYKLGVYIYFHVLEKFCCPPVIKFFSEGKEIE